MNLPSTQRGAALLMVLLMKYKHMGSNGRTGQVLFQALLAMEVMSIGHH